jgi:methionine synthase II (cobalamin-independent)
MSASRRTKPPFRADHVGSFLRPKTLLDLKVDSYFLKYDDASEVWGEA